MVSEQQKRNEWGPTLKVSKEIMELKYLQQGETFNQGMTRIAATLSGDQLTDHGANLFKKFRRILYTRRFLPGGRIQSSIGATRQTTAFNCFVADTLPDSMDGIMKVAHEAANTLRLGGGIGYDFSTLRPRGDLIKSLDSKSSGPIAFMDIFNSVCKTIMSAGHRRGAQMGCLRVDHPDIEEFIAAKANVDRLTHFNISVLITDEFMECVKENKPFTLTFEGRPYKVINARALWDKILRNTWDWAEPGVLFIDRINAKNNLWYTETIAATNPCLHPDTLIETVEGRVRIADIKEPTIVYTSMPDGSLGMARSTASWVSQTNAKVWKITTRNGKSIKTTSDHKFLVHNKGWVKACDLTLGDRIVQLCRARRGSEYSGVKLTTEDNRAYQMEHRMIAEAVYGSLGDNVVHHINNDTYDNHIDNFEVMTATEHNRLTALSTHPQEHQVHGTNGCFVSTGKSPKRITPMPEYLKSNMKNNHSNAVVEIIQDYETVDVYDLTVEGTHNMIGNFMVVHNCGEQPLPPHGACLLGSFNLTQYLEYEGDGKWDFNYDALKEDIPYVVEAMDNVIDNTVYPLEAQRQEALNKRRMGLGVTGVANALEILGLPYGSDGFMEALEAIMSTIAVEAYWASSKLATQKESFPLFNSGDYGGTFFEDALPEDLQESIRKYGIRNSHLLSVAPTGTISLSADNISSGIEPVFSHEYTRKITTFDGTQEELVKDYAWNFFGVKGRTANEIPVEDHVKVLCLASKYVDSACSKTCNVGPDVSWDRFKQVYMQAYDGGASGCTTFRLNGKRAGILEASSSEDVAEEPEVIPQVTPEDEGGACYIDPTTGIRSCDG